MTTDQRTANSQRQVLFHGGTVLTFDPTDTVHDAILIDGGIVSATGSREDLQRQAGSDVLEIELGGATVLPGLIDTHPHLLHYGTLEEPLVRIWDARNHDDIAARIRERAASTPAGQWIMTTPVGEPHYFYRRSFKALREGQLPPRGVLDRATDEHPVVIQAWAPVVPNTMALNSMALKVLGIDRKTPDQVGNVTIEKDESGQPTGRLSGYVNNYYSFDDFARDVWLRIPSLQLDQLIPGTKRAIAEFHKLGNTGVYENHMMEGPLIDTYRQLRRQGELAMRVMVSQECESHGMPWSQPRALDDYMARMAEAADAIELQDDYFRFNGLSIVWDGLATTGHLMTRQPYQGPDGAPTTGKYQVSPEKIELAMRFCAERGLRLNTLTGGTRANEENLAMLERLAKEYDIKSLHWLLIHSPLIEAEQVKRYNALNIDMTTSMTFCWGLGDDFREMPGIGTLKDLMPLRRCFDAGMAVAAGTDWGPKNAFEQIELALTHAFGRSGQRNLGPDQRITRIEAVSMWTRDAARVLEWPEMGSLVANTYADLVVVDRDPITCRVDDIGATNPLLTLLDGVPVHDAGALAGTEALAELGRGGWKS
jgi:predicted amidohydrolase YtcJ